jgi:hypothetical protein
MKTLAACAVLLALAVPAYAEVDNGAPARTEVTGMAAAANHFYATYTALPRQGGLPQGAALDRYLPLLSPRLAGLIRRADAAQARFHAKVKDAPPLIEGDLFSSQFEGFQTYKVGDCSGTATAGRCRVQLHYQPPNQKAVDWTDEILLVKAGGAWKVDDIAYRGAFAFGNSGLLSQTLNMVISTAP